MPAWIVWLTDHWLSVMITCGVVVAVAYVLFNRNMLFNKN
ncbi:hypothetical protein SAMN04487969_10580 [Paenibacillus algorifonticola]|uniref:Uncharacterized protein n=1 Tax=Paenibacillus algorifonticola TaxID=684063 RepID=A0A1I2CHP9_9BACL|nr:hypothetical protein SAMN04487969_10580 [Paenibacillus algorifonticola]